MIRRIIAIMGAPFRDSARINRDVLLKYLSTLRGAFVELGPGGAPLLEQLPNVADHDKIAIDFEATLGHCRDLGYRCLNHDLGQDPWDIADASVDVIVTSQCLEHIPDTDHVIEQAHRILKPGGHLLISVPNQGALAYVLMLLLTINPPMNMVSNRYIGLGNVFSRHRGTKIPEYGTQGFGHLRLFTHRALNELLEVYGFRIVANHGATWGVPWLGRALAAWFPYYGLFTIVLAQKRQQTPAP